MLKHQQPAAKGISAKVKLKLNALSATTIITNANSIHITRVLTGQCPSYLLQPKTRKGRYTTLLPIRLILVYCLIHQVISAGQ